MITNEFYTIRFLIPELLLIKWHQSPMQGAIEGLVFIDVLSEILEKSKQPIYVLSDLTQGRLMDVVQIRQLAKLTHHPHYAGSVAFGGHYQTSVYGGLFATVANRGDEICQDLAQALTRLEALKPGITATISQTELETLVG